MLPSLDYKKFKGNLYQFNLYYSFNCGQEINTTQQKKKIINAMIQRALGPIYKENKKKEKARKRNFVVLSSEILQFKNVIMIWTSN